MSLAPNCVRSDGRRRWLSRLAFAAVGAGLAARTFPVAAGITDQDASTGLRAALEKGVAAAVSQLGASDGFMGNEKIRITLPGVLNDAARMLKTVGQGKRVEDLILRMNRAAEAAVPLAREALVDAIHRMTLTDVRKILTGGDTAATQYFTEKTRESLSVKLLPTVQQSLEKAGAVAAYNDFAGRASALGLLRKDESTLERHVTAKALDGVYWAIGEEERRIRQDPLGAGSEVLKRVFGSLR